ncbi:hypothetical protein [Chroococcus sp. FPU101]|uniref:hypothetical protein n=1 Tax=Chroococcus sp. FPU101 TaxID=1974212 RepID=UPI001A90AD0D|nr:hypothetical protein [Chroococcus sp. FPU101]
MFRVDLWEQIVPTTVSPRYNRADKLSLLSVAYPFTRNKRQCKGYSIEPKEAGESLLTSFYFKITTTETLI